jgi:hypothetical protein
VSQKSANVPKSQDGLSISYMSKRCWEQMYVLLRRGHSFGDNVRHVLALSFSPSFSCLISMTSLEVLSLQLIEDVARTPESF